MPRLGSELPPHLVVVANLAEWSCKMGSQLFTSKKMKLEKASWLKKGIIGTVVVAVLSAAGFGVYSWAGSESQAPQESRKSRSTTANEPKRTSFLPSFATSSNSVKSNFSGKKQAEHKSKKSKSQKVASHKKHKGKKVASHKKHKGQKVASHKKHKGHKLASNKKHKGHKLASHKKKHGKKMVHKAKKRQAKELAAN